MTLIAINAKNGFSISPRPSEGRGPDFRTFRPRPKKRHHKRCFFCSANLEQLLRCLKTGGNLRIATDYPEYFELITELMEANKSRLEPKPVENGLGEPIEFLPTAGAKDAESRPLPQGRDEWAGTNFERKYLKQQKPIFSPATLRSTLRSTSRCKENIVCTNGECGFYSFLKYSR